MIRTLCLTLALATSICATIAVATYSSPAPAATPTATKEEPVRNEGVRPVNPSDPCRTAVWPQIPAECIKNDQDGRVKRSVRVIPIHSAGAN